MSRYNSAKATICRKITTNRILFHFAPQAEKNRPGILPGRSQTVEKPCHCEPVRTLAWQSPEFSNNSLLKLRDFTSFGGSHHRHSLRSPHQPAGWFAMTSNFRDFFDTLSREDSCLLCFFVQKSNAAFWDFAGLERSIFILYRAPNAALPTPPSKLRPPAGSAACQMSNLHRNFSKSYRFCTKFTLYNIAAILYNESVRRYR